MRFPRIWAIRLRGCVSQRAGTALRRGERIYQFNCTAARLRRRRKMTETGWQFPSWQRHCESGFVRRSKIDCWRKIASLTMSALSNTFWAYCSVHSEERATSLLVEGFALTMPTRSARNPFQVLDSVRPMHLFGHTFDHDYYFELPREGERDTHSITRCFTSHHRDFRAFPRTNRTFSTARNPIPCASSNTNEPPVSVPWRP